MTDQKPQLVYAASYQNLSDAEADLDALEQLHKDNVIGTFDAAVIDKKDGKPHVAKRMDRPSVRVIPEWFGGGKLPRVGLPAARPCAVAGLPVGRGRPGRVL